METKKNNVIGHVVRTNKCCGCGICTVVDATGGLRMKFNKYGEFIPTVSQCNGCRECLQVCPFSDNNFEDSEENNKTPLGNYIKNYVGYSMMGDERKCASSGGLTTRILKTLLERKIVDGAIVVGPTNKEDRLFEPLIAQSPQEIESAMRSKYYPIEFSSVLKTLKKASGKYAIVTLPCAAKAIRLLQGKTPFFKEKIKYVFSLACGHNKNKNYTSMLLWLAGANEDDISTVSFRNKDNTGKATNYSFVGTRKDGSLTRQLKFRESLVKELWSQYYFSIPACFHCNDLFGAYADATFMDAWLAPYINDPLGTSIVVVRNNDLMRVIQEEKKDNNIKVEEINESDVIRSQLEVFNFKQKKLIQKRHFLTNKILSDILSLNKMIGFFILKLRALLLRNYRNSKRYN
jgi:coenzyme F420 hydrogenase subunit beta